jgi:serine/threonine protein kinase
MSGRSISNCNMGTLCYSSPEVVNSEEFDTRADIWSLGCIIYELCTFMLPFSSSNERSLIDKITNQKPPEFPNNYSKDLK